MSVRSAIERHVHEAIERLSLAAGPVTFESIWRAAEDRLGKPIVIEPLDALPARDRPGSITGLYVNTARRAVIHYHRDDAKTLQLFSNLHEIFHIAAGHEGCHVPVHLAEAGYRGIESEIKIVRARVPLSSPSREVSAHDLEEMVAEEGARELLRLLRRQPPSAADAFA